MAAQNWHEKWYEGQYDDLGKWCYEKCAVSCESKAFIFIAQSLD